MTPSEQQLDGQDWKLLLAFVLSGFAALGYQFLWIRLLTAVVGSETMAVTGVIAGFFLGMSLGSLLLRDRVRVSARPALLFAVLEMSAAAYAIASPWVIPWVGQGLLRWVPAGLPPGAILLSSVATSVALLLPSFCLGATLPALVAAGERRRDPGLLSIGRLYAANTLGAMLGTLAGVYLIFAAGGFGWGALFLGAAGLASAALAISWQRRQQGHAGPVTPKPEAADFSRPASVFPSLLLLLSGLAGIGMEIVAARVMTQVMRSTVYTYANLLAIYLVGTAAGAYLYARIADRMAIARSASVLVWLLAAGATSTAAAAWALQTTPAIMERIAPEGATFLQQCAAELLSAAVVFLLPTVIMGALFSHLMGMASARGKGTGGAYAANTLGGALAPLAYAIVIIPISGYRGAMLAVGATYLLAVMLAGLRQSRHWLVAAAVSVAALAFLPRLVLIKPERGWRVLAEWQGIMGLTRVTELNPGAWSGSRPVRMLQVDQHFFMGGGTGISESRMGQMPLMLAPGARDVLYLGVGTGATAGAVARFPHVQHADAVELVPEVLQALPWFDAVNADVRHDPRVRFHASDAIRFAANPPRRYDLVVGDLFHPHRDGAAFLYTTDHFRNVRDRCLKPGSPFCQWVPLFQFDPESLRILIQSFLSVFPESHAFLGDAGAEAPLLLLVGRAPRTAGDRLLIDVPEGAFPHAADHLTSVTLTDLLGSYLLDREGLAAFAGGSPANTNSHPRLLFSVPRANPAEHGGASFASLQVLLASTPSPQPLPIRAASSAAHKTATSAAGARANAMRKLFEADVLRITAGDDPDQPRQARAAALEARDADPTYVPAQLLIKLLSDPASRPESRDRPLPR